MDALQPSGSTWDVLAGVRFALAMIVACGHLVLGGHVNPVVQAVAQGSLFVAVLCFLTISGYSIGHSLAARRDGFYRRRFLRIYPLYAVAVLYGLAAYMLSHPTRLADVRSAVANLGFLQTFLASPAPGNGVVWTLPIEVACYAAAPALARLPTAVLVGLTGASAAAYAAVPHLHLAAFYGAYRWGTPLLILAWAWLAGFLYHRHEDEPLAGLLVMSTLVGLTALNPTFCGPYAQITIVAAVTLMVVGRRIDLPAPLRATLSYAGDLSYPLYLYHMPTYALLDLCCHRDLPYLWLTSATGVSALMLVADGRVKRPLAIALNRVVASGRPAASVRATVPTAPIARGPLAPSETNAGRPATASEPADGTGRAG